jgi:hypothetical protein
VSPQYLLPLHLCFCLYQEYQKLCQCLNDIIAHETAVGIPESAVLTMIDLIKTSFIIFNPDMLLLSNIGEAILINITLFAKLQFI